MCTKPKLKNCDVLPTVVRGHQCFAFDFQTTILSETIDLTALNNSQTTENIRKWIDLTSSISQSPISHKNTTGY